MIPVNTAKQAADAKLKEALLLYMEERLAAFPSEEELERTVSFSPGFKRKMDKLIRQRRKPYYTLLNTTMKRAAAVILVVILSFSAAMSVEAIRTPVVRFFIEVYEKFSTVFFSAEEDSPSVIDLENEVYLPSYLPEGFEVVSQFEDILFIHYEYENEDGHFIIYEQSVLDTDLSINTEDIETEEIEILDFTGIYFENLGMHSLLWSNGEYIFMVTSDLKQEEIMRISESLTKKQKYF